MTAPTLPTHVFGDAILSVPSLGQDPGAYPSTAVFPTASTYPAPGLFSGGSALPVNVLVDADLADPGVFDAVLQTT